MAKNNHDNEENLEINNENEQVFKLSY